CLDGGETARPGLARRAVAFAVLTAACLVNPIGHHAFALPPEFRGLGLGAATAGPVSSPFQSGSLSIRGQTPAGLAYYVLLALSLASFFLNLRRWRWQRFLPWAGLAVVSALQLRAVPFFSVVAGPVLAWNLDEFLATRWANAGRPEGSRFPRLLTG